MEKAKRRKSRTLLHAGTKSYRIISLRIKEKGLDTIKPR